VPVEFAVGVYGDLMTAGADLGGTNAGYYAIESLRLEKGYRAFGPELTPDHNPVEAGLMVACKLAGSVAFLGVNVGGRLVSATVGLRPPFDPDGTKVRSAYRGRVTPAGGWDWDFRSRRTGRRARSRSSAGLPASGARRAAPARRSRR
jgi:Aminomethyltransferase folate-binding domain